MGKVIISEAANFSRFNPGGRYGVDGRCNVVGSCAEADVILEKEGTGNRSCRQST